MMSHTITTCRSCGAEVIWARSPRGRRLPFNAEPSSGGTWLLEDGEFGVPVAVYCIGGCRAAHWGELRLSHLATCPQALEWRARERAKRSMLRGEAAPPGAGE